MSDSAPAADCSTCRFVWPDNTCHAHPPNAVVGLMGQTTATWIWPSVASDDWCGEFQPVLPPGPVNTAPPTVTGNPVVAWRLTSDNGQWANPVTSYAYQWMSNGAPLTGQTGPNHVCTDQDAGTTLTCQLTATNAEGSAVALSNAVPVVQGPPVNQSPPIATLNPSYVLCTGGQWTGGATVYNYQWYANNVLIAGATNSSWVFSGYGGQAAYCAVTVTNAEGTCPPVNTNIVTIPPAPVNTTPPVISGALPHGNVLTCTQGAWSNSPTSYAYSWRRNGTPISGATSSTYTTVAADQTMNMTCVVTATNASGNGLMASNILGPIS